MESSQQPLERTCRCVHVLMSFSVIKLPGRSLEGPTPSRFCFSGLGVLFELGVLSLPGNATAGLRDPPLCAVALKIFAAHLEQVSTYMKK